MKKSEFFGFHVKRQINIIPVLCGLMNTLFDGFSKKLKPEGIKWKQGFIVQHRSMSESVYKSLEIEYI